MQHQLQIIPISAFADNYIWLIHNGKQALAIDPGDAKPVLDVLTKLGLQLECILITHHHHDHIGGVNSLMQAFPDVRIFAPKQENYDFTHTPVCASTITVAGWLGNVRVIDVPGHTLGHVAYYIEHGSQKWLFCGDTLFGAGCGRLFEGTPAQMLASLQKLASLTGDTQVYCTHEYTLHNISFALTLEPNNTELIQREQDTRALRVSGRPSLPSTIALELATNPFLRCDSSEIQSSVQLENCVPLQVFSKIRELRNTY